MSKKEGKEQGMKNEEVRMEEHGMQNLHKKGSLARMSNIIP